MLAADLQVLEILPVTGQVHPAPEAQQQGDVSSSCCRLGSTASGIDRTTNDLLHAAPVITSAIAAEASTAITLYVPPPLLLGVGRVERQGGKAVTSARSAAPTVSTAKMLSRG